MALEDMNRREKSDEKSCVETFFVMSRRYLAQKMASQNQFVTKEDVPSNDVELTLEGEQSNVLAVVSDWDQPSEARFSLRHVIYGEILSSP